MPTVRDWASAERILLQGHRVYAQIPQGREIKAAIEDCLKAVRAQLPQQEMF